MKLAIPLLFLALIIHTECKPDWIPGQLYDKVANKTNEMKKYVNDFKKFYVNNVKTKISSYFGGGQAGRKLAKTVPSETKSPAEYHPETQFKDYVETAEKTGKKIFDVIAPESIKYKCLEEDPAVHMTTLQLIALHGYPAEAHTIKTEDGYLLTLHRIPYSKTKSESPRKTAYLHHGLLGSSADWVIPGPRKALAFILSDAGYDVWLANVRGNTYSRAHVSYNVDTYAFWNFTWHEVSQYDLPAAIDHIMQVKGAMTKIDYIGHSMGTTVLFALLSTKPRYNQVLKAGYALAPVAYMSDIKSPIHILARFSNNIQYLMKLLGVNEFLPQNSVLRWLSKHACEINHYEEVLCENSLFVICGPDSKQFNKTLLPLFLGHVPAGASTKTLIHYAQEIRKGGKFQQYDYGTTENMRRYGNPEPPEYAVKNITLPIALISSQNDWLASEADVTKLYKALANPMMHYVVPMKEFNHLDFLWAIDAPKLVYEKLLQLMVIAEQNVSDNEINVERV